MQHRPRTTPQFEATECFGQLRSILRFNLPAGIVPSVTETTTLVLTIVWSTEVSYETSLKIPYYNDLGCLEAVNMSTISKLWKVWYDPTAPGDCQQEDIVNYMGL